MNIKNKIIEYDTKIIYELLAELSSLTEEDKDSISMELADLLILSEKDIDKITKDE